ncbi:hypothetical protein NN3_49360 [Nocardia neocaledoniensis NBRC 108232]|uniref:DUF7144 domain-containing protein n=1 Tax=Nocardia neocaledoniensis TaxID=236511 RepID=A0A317NAG4_9NOCA|nr:hypothetical protein [Nocardia neocaledoniensis]PWV70598.1 hypothetical protein DFR69_11217 [Nocardia neocaledoniensis]GEM33929.1 hypothetical protein NN3_49360 [Nocardia neocaledoniensis NBRC 108232]
MTAPALDPPWRRGLTASIALLAVALLLVDGVLAILRGIAGLAGDEIFGTPTGYTFRLDATAWGWIHLAVGIGGVAVALGLILSATWARLITIGLAALSIVVNFLSLPYCPWWSAILLGLDVAIIWAVAHWEPEPS